MKTLRFARRYVLAEMLVLLALFATPVRADREGDFIFNRDGATAWLWGYVGPGGAVVIPDRLGNLPVATISLAFSGRTDLTGVTIPNSVTSIGGSAFSGCTGLTRVTIPDSVTSVGYDAFSGCTGLTSVTIPNSVTFIEENAFTGCTGLMSVTIPNSVTHIGSQAFGSCTALRAIEVDSLNLVYSSAEGVLFDQAKSRLFVYPTSKAGPYTIPNSVTSIEGSAFSGCTGLTGVTIPNSVTSIGDSAFAGCTGLTSVTIPNSVTGIVSAAFSGCTALRAIEVDSLNLAYTSAAGVLFNKAKSWLIAYPAGRAGPYTIPNSVTDILWFAFSGCTGLTSVTVPSSVTGIRMVAFAGCKSLTSINLPTSLTSIGPSAFSGCSGLTGVTIPDSVTYIGHWAFSGCTALTTVTIPNAVTEIGIAAFTSCTGLTNVTISDGVTGIPPAMFQGCTALTSVVIPKSVTNVGNGAFSDCTSLTSVYCEGNAPDVNLATEGVFLGSAFVTVFYHAGTAGWGHTFAGRPTAVWVPRPAFGDWALSMGLAAQFPNASAEGDDPDGDGFTNGAEWFTATDPTQRASRLELELTPRAADLSASDQTPIEPGQHAVYLRSVAGHYYGVQRATSLGGAWELQATKVATTTQTRFVLPKPVDHGFYRVLALP